MLQADGVRARRAQRDRRQAYLQRIREAAEAKLRAEEEKVRAAEAAAAAALEAQRATKKGKRGGSQTDKRSTSRSRSAARKK